VDHQEKLAKFEALVLCHLDSAFNLARWLTRNEDDSRDLMQEAALRAFRAFENFKGEDGKVWLLVIVRKPVLYLDLTEAAGIAVFDEEIHAPGNLGQSGSSVI